MTTPVAGTPPVGDLNTILEAVERHGKQLTEVGSTAELVKGMLDRGVFLFPEDREPRTFCIGPSDVLSSETALDGTEIVKGAEVLLATYTVPVGRVARVNMEYYARVITALAAGQVFAQFARRSRKNGKQVISRPTTGNASAAGTTIVVAHYDPYCWLQEHEKLDVVIILEAGAGEMRAQAVISGIEYNAASI